MEDGLRPTGKVLSQREVDQLLEELANSDWPDFSKSLPKPDWESLLQKEDRKRDEHRIYVIRGRMKRLETINDSFARFISQSLSDFLFQEISFNPISIDIELGKQYTRQLPVPVILFKMDCHPLNHPMFGCMDNRLVSLFVQLASGNKLEQTRNDRRTDYTMGERKLIEPIIYLIKNELTSSWSNAIADFRISNVEQIHSPMEMEDIYADTPFAIITFEVEIEEHFLGCFQITVPTPPLEPIMVILQSQSTMRLLSCMDVDFIKIIKEREKDKLVWLEKNVSKGTPYQKLNDVDTDNLAQLLSRESPYITASILSFLKPEIYSQILSRLPKRVQEDVSERVKNIKIRQPVFTNILDEYFSGKYIPQSYSSDRIEED